MQGLAELHPGWYELLEPATEPDTSRHPATSRELELRETPYFRMDPMFWMNRRRDFIDQATREHLVQQSGRFSCCQGRPARLRPGYGG